MISLLRPIIVLCLWTLSKGILEQYNREPPQYSNSWVVLIAILLVSLLKDYLP